MTGWGFEVLGLNVKSGCFAFIWGAFCLWLFESQSDPDIYAALFVAGLTLVIASAKSLSPFVVCVVFFIYFSFGGAVRGSALAFWCLVLYF